MKTKNFRKELETLINRHSKENGSNTPDFILAEYLNDCLTTYDKTVKHRDKWFHFDPWANKISMQLNEQQNERD